MTADALMVMFIWIKGYSTFKVVHTYSSIYPFNYRLTSY